MAWFRGDCHVHSRHSHGGELTPGELTAAARAAGLDFIAVTEHQAAADLAAWETPDLLVIAGQEVTTDGGHWLALGLPPGQVVGSVAEVDRAGGLCVVAHPHAPYPGGTFTYPHDGFAAVEVWNGRWRSELPWQADNEAALAGWAAGCARPAVGNSDVHLRDQIGTPQTVVRAAARDTAAILAGIRAGRSWIAESSTVHLTFTAEAGGRTAQIGDRLPPGAVARVRVGGVSAGVVAFHTDAGPRHRVALPPGGTGTAEWPVDRAARFVRAEVRHPDGRMAALTNPIVLG